MTTRLLLGDCRTVLATLDAESVDAVVCDPPYELGFMGRAWDSSGVAFDPETWRAVLRVLKPGGHLIAFGGTRTVHRIAVAIEDAGAEIRDTVHWCYWSGFPKSLDVSKAIDALAGAEREVVGSKLGLPGYHLSGHAGNGSTYAHGIGSSTPDTRAKASEITAPATADARQWNGWGTALKPAVEPAILARKPLRESSIARQVLATGTGALNIDGCRFAPGDPMWVGPDGEIGERVWRGSGERISFASYARDAEDTSIGLHPLGRWPANLIHTPKASREERELGCEGLPPRTGAEAVDRAEDSAGLSSPRAGAGRTAEGVRNWHPTVKPLHLMRWLVRLVTPPGGHVLDPFMGSGTTGMAAVGQGYRFTGIELDAEHTQIARARIEWAAAGGSLVCDVDDPRAEPEQPSLFGGAR